MILDKTVQPGGSRTARVAETVFLSDKGLSIVRSEEKTGRNKYSGKQWYRWVNVQSEQLIPRKDGGFYAKTIHYGRRVRFLTGFHRDIWQARQNHWVKQAFGKPIEELMPLPFHYGFDNPSSFLKYPDVPTMVVDKFGKTRYRKDLVRAVAQNDIRWTAMASEFRGLVPVDWIVELIQGHDKDHTGEYWSLSNTKFVGLRNVLKSMNPRSLRRVARDRAPLYYYTDIAQFGNGHIFEREIDCQGVRDLHDQLCIGRNFVQHAEIPQTDIAQSLDGIAAGPYKIVSAKHTEDLSRWASYMRNCIDGYGNRARKGSTTLFGIYEGENLVANMEIAGGQVHQLLGRFNSRFDGRGIIADVCKQNNISATTYWGSNDDYIY